MMTWIWFGAILCFGVLEAATAALVSIWFVGGSAAALVTALLGGPLWLQVTLFLTVSAGILLAFRPLARKVSGPAVPTNLDRAIGQTARVTEDIDNALGTGAVYVDGKTWTARSANGAAIPTGSSVRVERIEGVKLLVTMAQEPATDR